MLEEEGDLKKERETRERRGRDETRPVGEGRRHVDTKKKKTGD